MQNLGNLKPKERINYKCYEDVLFKFPTACNLGRNATKQTGQLHSTGVARLEKIILGLHKTFFVGMWDSRAGKVVTKF